MSEGLDADLKHVPESPFPIDTRVRNPVHHQDVARQKEKQAKAKATGTQYIGVGGGGAGNVLANDAVAKAIEKALQGKMAGAGAADGAGADFGADDQNVITVEGAGENGEDLILQIVNINDLDGGGVGLDGVPGGQEGLANILKQVLGDQAAHTILTQTKKNSGSRTPEEEEEEEVYSEDYL